MAASILIVDDERNIRRTVRMVLEGAGHEVSDVASAEEALNEVSQADFDLLIVDIRLPKMSGVDLLRTLKEKPESENLPIIVISGHASLAEAVNAVRLGAFDFLEKPLDRDRLLVSVGNALRSQELQRELRRLRNEVDSHFQMIGESSAMRALYTAIEKVAPTRGRVLITGESGTGKELVARAVHQLSDRRERAFVMLNCAAIPADLIESELFGHERGAFTGAQSRKKGMFELADGGTLFLDEIGDMSLPAQAKVLRALQSGEISRVGGERSIAVDVRVLAATNKDLEVEVREGRFRDDLYFRLNVVPLQTPALRERTEDIPLLAQAFFEHFAKEYGRREVRVAPEVYHRLSERSWPGNVRELRNVVERMVILGGPELHPDDVPGQASNSPAPEVAAADLPGVLVNVADSEELSLREFRDRAEEVFIRQVLDECDWNISKAALKLNVERTNLHKKMRGYGIRREG